MIEILTVMDTAGPAYADGLFDVIETQSTEAMDALKALAYVAIAAFSFGMAIKARMAIAACIVIGLTAAFVLWLIVGGGMTTVVTWVDEQLAAETVTSSTMTAI